MADLLLRPAAPPRHRPSSPLPAPPRTRRQQGADTNQFCQDSSRRRINNNMRQATPRMVAGSAAWLATQQVSSQSVLHDNNVRRCHVLLPSSRLLRSATSRRGAAASPLLQARASLSKTSPIGELHPNDPLCYWGQMQPVISLGHALLLPSSHAARQQPICRLPAARSSSRHQRATSHGREERGWEERSARVELMTIEQ